MTWGQLLEVEDLDAEIEGTGFTGRLAAMDQHIEVGSLLEHGHNEGEEAVPDLGLEIDELDTRGEVGGQAIALLLDQVL